jgi:hypothetical protein
MDDNLPQADRRLNEPEAFDNDAVHQWSAFLQQFDIAFRDYRSIDQRNLAHFPFGFCYFFVTSLFLATLAKRPEYWQLGRRLQEQRALFLKRQAQLSRIRSRARDALGRLRAHAVTGAPAEAATAGSI